MRVTHGVQMTPRSTPPPFFFFGAIYACQISTSAAKTPRSAVLIPTAQTPWAPTFAPVSMVTGWTTRKWLPAMPTLVQVCMRATWQTSLDEFWTIFNLWINLFYLFIYWCIWMCNSFFLFFGTDIDECSEEPDICGSQTVCTNAPGTFYCSCPDGFYPSTGILWIVGVSFCKSKLGITLQCHHDTPREYGDFRWSWPQVFGIFSIRSFLRW